MKDPFIQIANKPGHWLVLASDGESYHEVISGILACDCRDFRYRREGTIERCRHGKALKAHLEALAACPACGGRGAFLPRMTYASGPEPVVCGVCDGTGKRAEADPDLLAAADAFRSEQAEADLRRLFR